MKIALLIQTWLLEHSLALIAGVRRGVRRGWDALHVGAIAGVHCVRTLFPVVWRFLYDRGERVALRIGVAIAALLPVLRFLKAEYFAFVALINAAMAFGGQWLWVHTPQRCKPTLMRILPYLRGLRLAWFWACRAILTVLRIVRTDLGAAGHWLACVYRSKKIDWDLDRTSLQARVHKLSAQLQRTHLLSHAQVVYRNYRTTYSDYWQDFAKEIRAIWARLLLLRERTVINQAVEILSPFAKEKRDIFAASILINTLALAFPLLMLQLYDRILPHQSLDTLLTFALFVGGAVLIESLLRNLRSSSTAWIAARFEHNAMLALTERYLAEPLHQFERKGTGALMEDYKSIATLKYHYSGQTFQQLMDLPFTLIYIFITFFVSVWVGLLLIVGAAILILFTWRQGGDAPLLAKQQKEGDLRRANFLNEILKNIHTLKSITMEALMQRRYERLQEACAKLMAKITYSSEMATGLGNVFTPMMTILVTALGASLVVSEQMTNGELAACILLGMRALAPLQRLGSIWHRYQQDEILRDRLGAILKRPTLIPLAVDAQEPVPIPADAPPFAPASLELRNIFYRYHPNDPELFQNLSVRIAPGECVLVSGASGSGRSTLLQLFAGQLKPTAGEVYLGEEDVRNFQASTYAHRVAYVPSNAILFDGTILDNLTVFDPERMAFALQLAAQVGLTAYVAKLPRGWDTQVGDMATETLSPGYRQRIALVRALAGRPNVLLLDNATSALDAEGDKLLLELLQSLRGQLTIVMITNRQAFSTVATRLIYLQNGKVIEAVSSAGQSLATQDAVANPSDAHSDPVPHVVSMPSSYQPVVAHEFFKPPEYREIDDAKRWEQMHSTVGGSFKESTDFASCLVLLLKLLYCRFSAREVAESLPYYTEHLDLAGLQNAMAQLGFVATRMPCRLGELDARALPCLFIPEEGAAFVVVGRLGSQLRIATDAVNEPQLESDLQKVGWAYFYKKSDQVLAPGKSWCWQALWRFRPLIMQAGFSALISGVITITGTLFLMAVYGTVIPAGSQTTLFYLTLGCVVATAISYYFIRHRARILSFIGGRIEYLFGTAILQQLLRMPTAYTERASVGTQISRLQSFESVRDLFTGPLAATFLELPATVVLLVGLSAINPIALLLFAVLATVYALLYWGFFNEVHQRGLEVGNTSTKRNQFLIEMTSKMRTIRECGGQYMWLDRFREISADATMAGYRAEQISTLLVSISYFLMMMAALIIASLTTPAVINQTLTSGVLVASMMLMWRVLTPIQTVFVSMSRIERVRGAVRQIDALMNIQGERLENTASPVERGTKGQIEFARVSFRYAANVDPALTGVEFRIEPGKMVAISGPNGGGKSTVLKMLLGLYQPQAGSVLIDNIDIRQLDPFELRRLIGYAPQDLHLFRASIAQNLRLARPDATDNEVYQALDMAGALEQVLALPRGLDYRVGDNTDDLPATLRHKIILARAYITRAPIMVFDEPGAGLDEAGDQKFMDALQALKGNATVIFISHSPKHILLADTLMVFDKGYLRAAAPPGDLLKPPAAPAAA